MKKKTEKTFRVYINQVNQTYVEVQAKNEDVARERGYAKWRRQEGHSSVMSVIEIKDQNK